MIAIGIEKYNPISEIAYSVLRRWCSIVISLETHHKTNRWDIDLDQDSPSQELLIELMQCMIGKIMDKDNP